MIDKLNDLLVGRFFPRRSGKLMPFTVVGVFGEEGSDYRLIACSDDDGDVEFTSEDLTDLTFFRTREACQTFCDEQNCNQEAA